MLAEEERHVDKVKQLEECLAGGGATVGSGATVDVVEYRGRQYAVTRGTGEVSFGGDGGSGAFAYAVRDLRSASLDPDGWDYTRWCNTMPAPVEDVGLARELARDGVRLTRSGSCAAVLSDAEFRTLTTGHTRSSPRSEVSDDVIATLAPIVRAGGGEVAGLAIRCDPAPYPGGDI
jgi:hypothetical protein